MVVKENLEPIVLTLNRSNSNPEVWYEIRLSRRDNTVYCTCPGWRFSRGSTKSCTHLFRFVKEVGVQSETLNFRP